MVAGKLANLKKGRPAKNTQICAFTEPEAAKILGVSLRTVNSARAVLDRGTPALVAAVEEGDDRWQAREIAKSPAKEKWTN